MSISGKKFLFLFIVLSVLVGTVYSLPHLMRYQELQKTGEKYIVWTNESNFDMANVHGSRYREIINGNILPGEVDTYEHRKSPVVWPLLSASILAPFLLITSSLDASIIITDIVFAILIFISWFLLLNVFVKNKYFSITIAFLLMLFPQLPQLIPPSSFAELKNIIFQFLPNPSIDNLVVNLTYLRRDAFIPAGSFFILFFYFVYQSLAGKTKKKNKIFVVLAGLFYGLQFFFYIYYWIYTTIFLGILFLILSLKNKSNLVKKIIGIVVVGLIASIPFWLNHYYLSSLPQYEEITMRGGIEMGNAFRFELWKTYTLYLLFAGLIGFLGSKLKKNLSALFLIALCFTNIAVLNIQVVTGFNIQSDHWSGRVFLITNGLVVSVIVYYLFLYLQKRFDFLKYKKQIGLVVGLLFVMLISNIVVSQKILADEFAHQYTISENLLVSYQWLNENTPKDSVVLAPSLESNINIPMMTHNNIFMARAQTTIAPKDEIVSRFLLGYKLFNISDDYLGGALNDLKVVMNLFSVTYESRALDRYLDPSRYGDLELPEGIKEDILNKYKNIDLSEIDNYRLDYIYIGPREGEMGINLDNLSQYNKIYSEAGVDIYQVNID